MTRSMILAASALSFASGCAHTKAERTEPKPALRKLDRAADAVGRVLYPPLYVAAFPLWFLAGGGGAAK